MRSQLVRAAVIAGAAATVMLAVPAPASAHVTVNPKSATQGGYAKVAFRVPNEKDNAQTTALEVVLPTDTPIASVSLRPMDGWTAATEKSKLATPIKVHDSELTQAVSKITWTAAAGNAIKPGQFQEFEVSFGLLPKTDRIVFKALQTYSDGDVVRWIEVPDGGKEPEHPAPVLTLTAAAGDTHSAAATPTPAAAGTVDSDNDRTNWLGITGIVMGLAGLIAGLLAYRRAARP